MCSLQRQIHQASAGRRPEAGNQTDMFAERRSSIQSGHSELLSAARELACGQHVSVRGSVLGGLGHLKQY